jgi:hypothetical protein
MKYRVEIILQKFIVGSGAECLSYNSPVDRKYSEVYDSMQEALKCRNFYQKIRKEMNQESDFSISHRTQSSEDGINWKYI